MKQIIPFKKELLFKTKVSEITSISLEHTLMLKEEDLISGEFHIMGDYKMTEGSIIRENFSFQLPFEIALDGEYQKDSIVIDIDNFYYEVINNEALQVNIDVYVEGEKLEKKEEVEVAVVEPVVEVSDVSFPSLENFVVEEEGGKDCDVKEEVVLERGVKEEEIVPVVKYDKPVKVNEELYEKMEQEMESKVVVEEFNNGSIDFDKMVVNNKLGSNMEDDGGKEKSIVNNFQIFENIDNSDTYVTYHVYIVKEGDTIDKIIEKYGTSKEDLQVYNSLEDIKPGTKIIIPN